MNKFIWSVMLAGTTCAVQAADIAVHDTSPGKVYTTKTGRILVNADNMTLYTFDKDRNGVPVCYDDCAEKWPPVIVGENVKLTPPFSSITRRDGQRQLRYNNMPLYLWKQDRAPGDTTGDNVKNVWHIISITQ